MRMSNYLPWLTWEEKFLRENWMLYAYVRDLADHLPRHTLGAIYKKAEELDLPTHENHTHPDRYTIAIWWALQEGPATPAQIKARTGASNWIILKALKSFREAGVTFVSHWVKEKPRGHWRPVWCVGDQLSRKKPAPNGKTHNKHVQRLENHKGNPFAALIVESQYGNSEHQEVLCP
jgi:hypothetical protein